MIHHEHQLRVRYGETDQMGNVYYGNFALYLEEARTAMIRELGISYKEMEANGFMLPVVEFHMKYRRAAHYDDLLTIRSEIREFPERMLVVHSSVYNEEGTFLSDGVVKLMFVNKESMKPTKAPDYFRQQLLQHWPGADSQS